MSSVEPDNEPWGADGGQPTGPPPPGAPPAPAPPPPGTPQPPGVAPRKRQPALLLFLGAVALILVGSIITIAAVRSGGDKPADVVRSFLQALADADAAKALSYTSAPPTDQTLLTDEVLASSRDRAPLHDIVVTPGPTTDDPVAAHYLLGDQPVSDHYSLSRVSGAYKIDTVTARVNFLGVIDAHLPVLVNGVQVTSQPAEVFPVSYVVTTGLPNVDWGENASAIVTLVGPNRAPAIEPRVTDAGKAAFLSGAKKLLDTCVAKHKLSPNGCPFGFRQPTSGPKIPDSTVRWKIKGNPYASLEDPEIESISAPGLAKKSTKITFTCTCRFSTGEVCKAQDVTNNVTFAGDVTTDPMKVVFTAF